MLHPYRIFFEELWRESARRLPDDDPADAEPTSAEATIDEPTPATGPRVAHRQRWRAVVRFRRRHAGRSSRAAAE